MNGCYYFGYLHPLPFSYLSAHLHHVSAHITWGGRILELNPCSARVPVADCEFLGKGTDLWERELLEPLATEQ